MAAADTPSKRPHEDDDDATSSSDEDVGPALPSAEPPTKKRRRVLPHEKLYVAALPTATRYSKSLMHKDQLAFVTMTPKTDFLITAGEAGQVSFWKKKGASADGDRDVEFVKEFRALGEGETLNAVAVSWDGRNYAACGSDGAVKIWDVVNFDLVGVVEAPFTQVEGKQKQPRSLCWVYGRHTGDGVPLLAVGNDFDGEILVLDGRGGRDPIVRIKSGRLHKAGVVAMAYHEGLDCVVSADASGMVEYWRPEESLAKPGHVWSMKSSTNLFDFKKNKSAPTSITLSPSGKHFATYSLPDRQIRIFDFASGKLHRCYDESIPTLTAMQQAGTAAANLDEAEFSRRIALEHEIDNPRFSSRINIIFDESSNFILYASLHGVKVVNTLTNRVAKLYGRDETMRSLNLALYQGTPDRKDVVTVEMAASDNPLLKEAEARDALLICTAISRQRFYLYTNDGDVDRSSRDVQNEKPRQLNAASKAKEEQEVKSALPGLVILHTTAGDISLRLFGTQTPKTVENFTTHCRNGYYNGTIFHRVIKKFMVQGGDPLGDGSGGESIWGSTFEDEIVPDLKHDRPFTLSMANAGPGTNGSQFFITTEKCPWLDGKHTVFGRAIEGLDVVKAIENTKTRKERPLDDIKIVSVDIR